MHSHRPLWASGATFRVGRLGLRNNRCSFRFPLLARAGRLAPAFGKSLGIRERAASDFALRHLHAPVSGYKGH
jgi:hypothetical protein